MNNIELKQRIDRCISSMEHELYGHILKNDEDSWNLEYYTNNKLDYRKLLIGLLKFYIDMLKYDGYKDPDNIRWYKDES